MSSSEMESSSIEIVPETIFDSPPLISSVTPAKSAEMFDSATAADLVIPPSGSEISADFGSLVPDTPPSPGENLEQIVADLLPTDDAYFLLSEVLKFRRKRKAEEAGIRRTGTPRAC